MTDYETRHELQNEELQTFCTFLAAENINPRMPRYCIFGDTINIASFMQTTSEGTIKIQTTRLTKDQIYLQTNRISQKILVET